jgi:hypothetical protein
VAMTSAEYFTGRGLSLSAEAKMTGVFVSEKRTPHAVRTDGSRDRAECGAPIDEVGGSWPAKGLGMWPCRECLTLTS